MNPNNLEMQRSVDANRNLFEQVNKAYIDAKNIFRVQYIILDYNKIVDSICSYVDDYMQYALKGDNKFKDRVLPTTRNLYERMFIDKEYKKVINIEEFKDDNYNFLVKSKALKDRLVDIMSGGNKVTGEMNSIIRLTDNQYKKLMKVYHDDMKIYLWIVSSNSTHFKFNLDDKVKNAFMNKRTPVMHKYKKSDWE